MPYPQFDRCKVLMKPLASRANKKNIERDKVLPSHEPRAMSEQGTQLVAEAAERIRTAKANGKPIMLTFGAHTIKNGLSPVLIDLIEKGWITHLATNGAGVIHDWEFSFQGETSEDVRSNVARGEFGNWQETGFYLNLALVVGAYEGKGYGESIGAMICHEHLLLPTPDQLTAESREKMTDKPEQAAAALDLLTTMRSFDLPAGEMRIPHPFKQYSVQANAFAHSVPFTGHPMFGHDIIYNHPLNHGAAIGRVAQRDFLTFAESISRIDGGVYLSVGSAVMSPMIFEKSMSMAQNLAQQQGRRMENHFIMIVDLAESHWDWTRGEPPENSPDYYLRYNKSFARMGGEMRYLQADNRDFLLTLSYELAQ